MTIEKLTAGDPDTQSAAVVDENVDRLRELFPEAFTEGRVDFDVLRQLLGDAVEDGDERYGLNWRGKRAARRLALTPSTGTLRPAPEQSVDWDTTQNLMIEGDNLEVLKLLRKSYAGKVKLIYIDPPYNVGTDRIYPDDYSDSVGNYLMLTGQTDSDGRALTSNSETSGRFHTDWLNMIYPRIQVARDLLRPDGVMFASIDSREVDNLVKVCDEIFGEQNQIDIICHKSRASVSNDKILSPNHNFIVLYARDRALLEERRREFGLDPVLTGFDKVDERGNFKYVPVDGPGGGAKGNPHYTFLGVTGYFRFSKDRMEAMHTQGLIERVGNSLQQKYYLEEARNSRKTDTTWWDDGYLTSTATARLKDLLGGDAFDNPKPVELIERMLELWARDHSDLVLDFFAGSGATGHAVLERNAVTGGTTRFMLVQLPEVLDPEKKEQKDGADYCDSIGKPRRITEITKERLRRAAAKIRNDHPNYMGDLGFRVLRLDSSNILEWEPDRDELERTLDAAVENLKADRTEQDILYELLLKRGIELTVPIKARDISGKTVHSIGAGTLFACLAERIERADAEPLALGIVAWRDELDPAGDVRVVFRDSAFADDVAKTNLAEILRQHGLADVKSI